MSVNGERHHESGERIETRDDVIPEQETRMRSRIPEKEEEDVEQKGSLFLASDDGR